MKILVLDGTAISIQVAMTTSAATTNPTFVSTYADNAGSGITEGATDGALNGSTDVTVVPAPTGSNRRVIKGITIFNGDTAAVTVLIKYDNNATQRTLVKVTLAVGDTWTTDGVFDTNGNLKQITGGVGVLPIANGGTNATTASDARTNLGLVIGTDVLAPTGSAASLTSFPTLNQNTTGSAATVTGNATGSTFGFNSGYGSVATAYGCRSWVNFNGTGTVAIRASANVSSITDNNVGRYTVNFTTAMPDANYSTVGTCNFEVDVGLPVNTNSNATGSVQVTSYRPSPYNAYVDVSTMSVAVFR